MRRASSESGSVLFRRRGISPSVISKGRRAKRGRRREYREVFLHCGILSAREVVAIDGLKAMRGNDRRQTHLRLPDNEGLRQCVERFVEFVGCSENETPVEFWIPQVAHALALQDSTLKFIVHVLLAFQVLAEREDGTYLWQGTEAVCNLCQNNLTQTNHGDLQHFAGESSDLSKFCLALVDTLKNFSKESISFECLSQEMMVQNDHSQIHGQLEVVCSILLGAGILHEIKRGSELFFTLRPPSNSSIDLPKLEIPSVCSLSVDQNQASGNSVKQWNVGTPVSLSVVLDDNVLGKKMLGSLVQRLNSAGLALHNNKMSIEAPLQATVMEIAKTGICQVGVANVLGHGSLTSPNNEWANSVIALAIPQWMLTHKQTTQPTHQIHAYEIVGNGLASNKQPQFMSYMPVTRGSLSELFGQAVNGHKALMFNAEALQPSSSVLKQF